MNIFIDSNVLLDFYGFSSSDLEELRKIAKLSKAGKIKLFISDYVKDEFSRNREAAIATSIASFKNSHIELQLPNLVRVYPAETKLRAIKAGFEMQKAGLLNEVQKDINKSALIADSVIDEFFDSTKIHLVSAEIVKAGADRSIHARPPGKRNSCGDAVNWEWLLSTIPANEDLHIISADNDFQSPLCSGTLSNYLHAEWMSKKQSICKLYTSLAEFLSAHFPEIKLANEVDKMCAIELLETSPNFATTHNAIQKLLIFDDFRKEEILRLITAYSNNDQISNILGDKDVLEFSFKLMDYAEKAGLYEEIEPLFELLEQTDPTGTGLIIR